MFATEQIFGPPPATKEKKKERDEERERVLDIIRIFNGYKDHQSVLNVATIDLFDFSPINIKKNISLSQYVLSFFVSFSIHE